MSAFLFLRKRASVHCAKHLCRINLFAVRKCLFLHLPGNGAENQTGDFIKTVFNAF